MTVAPITLGDDTLEAIESVRPTVQLLISEGGDQSALPALRGLLDTLRET